MTAKHRPGPWGIFPHGEYKRMYIETENSPGYSICCFPAGHDETDKANARLIAAAPELLEALKMYVDTTSQPPDKLMEHILNVLDLAEKAIAKAEGINPPQT